jgi:hypothetical protein
VDLRRIEEAEREIWGEVFHCFADGHAADRRLVALRDGVCPECAMPHVDAELAGLKRRYREKSARSEIMVLPDGDVPLELLKRAVAVVRDSASPADPVASCAWVRAVLAELEAHTGPDAACLRDALIGTYHECDKRARALDLDLARVNQAVAVAKAALDDPTQPSVLAAHTELVACARLLCRGWYGEHPDRWGPALLDAVNEQITRLAGWLRALEDLTQVPSMGQRPDHGRFVSIKPPARDVAAGVADLRKVIAERQAELEKHLLLIERRLAERGPLNFLD